MLSHVNGQTREDRLDEAKLAWEEAKDAGASLDVEAFLARYPDLFAELMAFLARDHDIGRLVGQLHPVVALTETAPENVLPARSLSDDPVPWPSFPDYVIHERVEEGGMGVVYKAWQISLERFVALKCLRQRGREGEAEEGRRLIREARRQADLDHPHIVPIYEINGNEARPFFSMKFMEGGSLAARLASGAYKDQQAAARLLAVVARAVHHAHQRQILHRDLKPGNVLLDRRGEAHVTDFGLAQRLESADVRDAVDTDRTLRGVVAGTVSYMAPEQTIPHEKLSTAVDVYGLGAILYEMLTGRAPFVGDHRADIVRKVRETPVERPRKLRPRIDRDLEAICLKCLEKQPSHRFGSAEALAEELERFADDRPIETRPAGIVKRLSKWAKRRPALAVLSATLVLFIVFSVAGLWSQQRKTAAALDDAEQNLTCALIGQANYELSQENPDRAKNILNEIKEDRREWEWHYLMRRSYRKPLPLRGQQATVLAVQYSRDGTRLASAARDGTVIVWDAATGSILSKREGLGLNLASACFSSDLRLVFTAGSDRVVSVWDLTTGTRVWHKENAGRSVVADDGGQRFAVLSELETVTVWDIKSVAPVRRLQYKDARISQITLSPNGQYLLAAGYGGLLFLEDLAKPVPQKEEGVPVPLPFRAPAMPIAAGFAVAFSPDSQRFVAATDYVREWLTADPAHDPRELSPTGEAVANGLSYSPDGKRIAAMDRDGVVHIWDLETGKMLLGLTPPPATHSGPMISPSDGPGAVFSPLDSCHLAVFQKNDVTVFDLDRRAVPASLILGQQEAADQPRPRIEAIAFSPDEQLLASRAGKKVILWDTTSGQAVGTLALHEAGKGEMVFSRDGRLLIFAGASDCLQVWDVETGHRCDKPKFLGTDLRGVALSDDGICLAVADGHGAIHLWDLPSGMKKHYWPTDAGEQFALAFRPGKRQELVSCGRDGGVRLWDLRGNPHARYGRPTKGSITAVAFSPGDGQRLATASSDGDIRLWNTDKGTVWHDRVLKHDGYVAAVAFSPTGRRLASCGSDATIRLWDPESGREMLTLIGHQGMVNAVIFSPTGRWIASCSQDGTVRLWDSKVP